MRSATDQGSTSQMQQQSMLFMRLFESLKDRVTLKVVENPVYEQSTVEEEEGKLHRPERDLRVDPYLDIISFDNASEKHHKNQEEGHGQEDALSADNGSMPMPIPIPTMDSQIGDQVKARGNSRKRRRYEKTPVKVDTFFYCMMVRKDPLLLLQDTEDDRADGSMDRRVQDFKKLTLEAVLRSEDFLSDAGIETSYPSGHGGGERDIERDDAKQHEVQEEKGKRFKKRRGISERRAAHKRTEDILRAMDCRNFDKCAFDIALEHIARCLGFVISIEFHDDNNTRKTFGSSVAETHDRQLVELICDRQKRYHFII